MKLNRSFNKKAILQTMLMTATLVMQVTVHANDGKQPSTVPVKSSVPVTYYQAFMIAVAASYGIYLILRARKRKRNSKIIQ